MVVLFFQHNSVVITQIASFLLFYWTRYEYMPTLNWSLRVGSSHLVYVVSSFSLNKISPTVTITTQPVAFVDSLYQLAVVGGSHSGVVDCKTAHVLFTNLFNNILLQNTIINLIQKRNSSYTYI